MANVKIFTGSLCRYCSLAKNLLNSKGIEFTEVNLDGKPEERDELCKKTGFQTIPQIFIGETFVGGYRELSALEQSGELDKMINVHI